MNTWGWQSKLQQTHDLKLNYGDTNSIIYKLKERRKSGIICLFLLNTTDFKGILVLFVQSHRLTR